MPLMRWQPLRDIELWEPIREMESLQKEMNRLFDRFMHTGNGGSKGITFKPLVEMEETTEAVHLKLEIPGMEAKDIEVQVAEDSVMITGERREETKTEEKGMVRSEFRYGKFERMIPLLTQVASYRFRQTQQGQKSNKIPSRVKIGGEYAKRNNYDLCYH